MQSTEKNSNSRSKKKPAQPDIAKLLLWCS